MSFVEAKKSDVVLVQQLDEARVVAQHLWRDEERAQSLLGDHRFAARPLRRLARRRKCQCRHASLCHHVRVLTAKALQRDQHNA